MIEIRGLRVRRGGAVICTLDQLSVEDGEHVGVVGSNGSGKSTLLRVLAGLESWEEGDVRVAAAQNELTFVHQTPHLFQGTVLSNTTYGLRARGVRGKAAARRAHEVLAALGVDHLVRRRVGHLSGGERRRVALARAFCIRPRLLLLDEPFSDLDPAASDLVREALSQMPETTVVLTTPSEMFAHVASRMVELPAPTLHT